MFHQFWEQLLRLETRPNGFPRVGVLFLFCFLILCFSGCSNQHQVDETTKRGDQIVRALNAFHKDEGYYPGSLTDLVPKYIDEIPLPVWGLKEWKYEVRDIGYNLQVDESINTGNGSSLWLRYFEKENEWQFGD